MQFRVRRGSGPRRAQRAARAVLGQRGLGGEQLAEREAVGRARRTCPTRSEPARAEHDQLLGHDRRARAAHAGGLDGQRRAVGGHPAVAPQAAVVVEHLAAAVDQLLGEPQRAAGVAGEQDALGDGLVRAEVDGLWRHAAWYRTRVAGRHGEGQEEGQEGQEGRQGRRADALAAIRSAVERTLQASAEGAQSTRERTREIVDEIAAAAGKVRTRSRTCGCSTRSSACAARSRRSPRASRRWRSGPASAAPAEAAPRPKPAADASASRRRRASRRPPRSRRRRRSRAAAKQPAATKPRGDEAARRPSSRPRAGGQAAAAAKKPAAAREAGGRASPRRRKPAAREEAGRARSPRRRKPRRPRRSPPRQARGADAAAPAPRRRRPDARRRRSRRPGTRSHGRLVRVGEGAARGHRQDLLDDGRRPGHGAQAARRGHAAALRVHRLRRRREHPRGHATTRRATSTGSGRTTSTGSRRSR